MTPMPSLLNQTSISKQLGGGATVGITVGTIDAATVLVVMTPMPPVLMPAASPQQTLYDATFAVVVDG
jgi:hypothetical protein